MEQLRNLAVDKQWEVIMNRIITAVNRWVFVVAGKSTKSKKRPQWMDDRLLSKIKKKNQHSRTQRKEKTTSRILQPGMLQSQKQEEQSGIMKKKRPN